MTPSADILIKIFSGPHLGAEVPLSPGSATLGSDSTCDIILKDTTVAGHHLTVTISDPKVSVTIQEAPVTFVPGKKTAHAGDEGEKEPPGKGEQQVVRGTAAWPARTLMMVGTCAMAWRREGEDWGDIAATTALLDSLLTPGPEPEPDSEKDREEKRPRAILLPPLARLLLKGIGLVLIFLFVFGPCMGIKSTRMARDMAGVLADEGFDYLTVKQTNIGVTVMGTVATQADRSRLWQMAGKVDYPVFIDIQVDEERAYAVKVALSVRGLFPEVLLREKDIIIKGYMRDKLIEGAARVWIKRDISQVNEVDSKMVYAFQVWPILKDRLIKYELDKLVVVRFHPGLVQVEGELSFDQREILEKVKGEVCDELNSPVAFWDTLTAPGFSQEWNDSLNSSLRSKYAPDPGLSRLFLDSQSAKGVPAFVAFTPALKAKEGVIAVPGTPQSSVTARVAKDLEEAVKGADIIEAEDGRHLAVIKDKDGKIKGALLLDKEGKVVKTPSGSPIFLPVIRDKDGRVVRDRRGNPVMGRPLRDKDGQAIPLTVARNADGRVIRDREGNPQLVPALLDKKGRVVRDKQGRPVAPRVISGTDDRAVFDKEGRLIPDSDANKVLTGEMTGNPGGGPGGAIPPKDGKIRSDKEVFGSGTSVANKVGQEPEEDPLGGLSITSITLNPIAFIGMRDGQKFFAGGKLPTGWVIRSIATDRIVVEKAGKTKTIKMRSR